MSQTDPPLGERSGESGILSECPAVVVGVIPVAFVPHIGGSPASAGDNTFFQLRFPDGTLQSVLAVFPSIMVLTDSMTFPLDSFQASTSAYDAISVELPWYSPSPAMPSRSPSNMR